MFLCSLSGVWKIPNEWIWDAPHERNIKKKITLFWMKSMLKIMKFNWEFNMNLNCFRLQNIHSRRLIPHFWNQFGWSIHMICKICNVFTRFLSIKGSNLEEGDFFFPLKIGTIIEDYQKNIQRLSVFTSRSGPMAINNIIFSFATHTEQRW